MDQTTESEQPAGEFTGIFEAQPDRPPMSRPPKVEASMVFIREVTQALEALGVQIPVESREEVADWVANKMERYGAWTAEPVFLMDGSGPRCSWCGMIWPLCGHHHQSGQLSRDDDGETGE